MKASPSDSLENVLFPLDTRSIASTPPKRSFPELAADFQNRVSPSQISPREPLDFPRTLDKEQQEASFSPTARGTIASVEGDKLLDRRDGWLAKSSDSPPRCSCLFCCSYPVQKRQASSEGEMVSAAAEPSPQSDRLDPLFSGFQWDDTTITYSFYDDDSNGYYGAETVWEVSETVKDNVRMILEEVIEPYIGLDFVEVADTGSSYGQIRYMFSDGPGYAYSYYPLGGDTLAGDVHLSDNREDDPVNSFSQTPGNYGYETLIHETGHALGLKHPGNYDDNSDTPPFLPFEEDNSTNTVMTYNGGGQRLVTPMTYDIAALQSLYGAGNLNGDRTIYRFQDVDLYVVNGRESHSASIHVKQTLWDSGGRDTLDFSALSDRSAGYRFELEEGGILTTQSAYNGSSYQARGDSLEDTYTTTSYGTAIAFNTVIEDVITSPSDDIIVANSAANRFGGYFPGKSTGEDVIIEADNRDTIDLSMFSSDRVKEVPSGNDLILELGSEGEIRVDDFYAGSASSRPQITYLSNAVATIGEFGRISGLTHERKTISLQGNYDNPVVIVQPPSYNGTDPVVVRLDEVSGNELTAFLQEPLASDIIHPNSESVSYMVLEAGTWQLADGTLLEVGSVETNLLAARGWESVDFEQDFAATPAIFSQVQTYNGSDPVLTRQQDATSEGFSIAMQEEEQREKDANPTHTDEIIGYIALEENSGTWSGRRYHSDRSSKSFDESWSSLDFAPTFASAPQFFGSIATFEGSDPVTLRYRQPSADNIQIRLQEDRSFDSEIEHNDEEINFLAIAGSGFLEAGAIA